MVEVIGFVDWLPQNRLFATIPSYDLGLRWPQMMKSLDSHASALLYRVISILCQTLVYGPWPLPPFSPLTTGTDLIHHGTKGVYLCLFPIAVYILL